MNTQIFNLLPNIVKQVKVVETKNNVIDYICGFDYKTVDTNEWIIFFPEKYDLEPDGLFWSKPKFTFTPIFPFNKRFKEARFTLSLSPVKNVLKVVSNGETIFETNVYNQHIEIVLPYHQKYEFETNPYIPPNDDRQLGIYISKIDIVDLDNSVQTLKYSNLTSCDISAVKCVNYE